MKTPSNSNNKQLENRVFVYGYKSTFAIIYNLLLVYL